MCECDLMLGDCLEKMKKIKDGSVDLVLTDLPYGITHCKWDAPLPLDALWAELNRVTKHNGAFVFFGVEPFSSVLRMSNIKNYKYDWIWKKRTSFGFLNAKKQPLRNMENICVFYRKQCLYNPQFIFGKPYKRVRRGRVVLYNKIKNITNTISDGRRYPKQILEFKHDTGGYHPTQKPVALLEYLIKTYTNHGEVVLDCCMGSGSTGVACVNTGRKFIGIELDEKYYQTACERIAEAEAEQKG